MDAAALGGGEPAILTNADLIGALMNEDENCSLQGSPLVGQQIMGKLATAPLLDFSSDGDMDLEIPSALDLAKDGTSAGDAGREETISEVLLSVPEEVEGNAQGGQPPLFWRETICSPSLRPARRYSKELSSNDLVDLALLLDELEGREAAVSSGLVSISRGPTSGPLSPAAASSAEICSSSSSSFSPLASAVDSGSTALKLYLSDLDLDEEDWASCLGDLGAMVPSESPLSWLDDKGNQGSNKDGAAEAKEGLLSGSFPGPGDGTGDLRADMSCVEQTSEGAIYSCSALMEGATAGSLTPALRTAVARAALNAARAKALQRNEAPAESRAVARASAALEAAMSIAEDQQHMGQTSGKAAAVVRRALEGRFTTWREALGLGQEGHQPGGSPLTVEERVKHLRKVLAAAKGQATGKGGTGVAATEDEPRQGGLTPPGSLRDRIKALLAPHGRRPSYVVNPRPRENPSALVTPERTAVASESRSCMSGAVSQCQSPGQTPGSAHIDGGGTQAQRFSLGMKRRCSPKRSPHEQEAEDRRVEAAIRRLRRKLGNEEPEEGHDIPSSSPMAADLSAAGNPSSENSQGGRARHACTRLLAALKSNVSPARDVTEGILEPLGAPRCKSEPPPESARDGNMSSSLLQGLEPDLKDPPKDGPGQGFSLSTRLALVTHKLETKKKRALPGSP